MNRKCLLFSKLSTRESREKSVKSQTEQEHERLPQSPNDRVPQEHERVELKDKRDNFSKLSTKSQEENVRSQTNQGNKSNDFSNLSTSRKNNQDVKSKTGQENQRQECSQCSAKSREKNRSVKSQTESEKKRSNQENQKVPQENKRENFSQCSRKSREKNQSVKSQTRSEDERILQENEKVKLENENLQKANERVTKEPSVYRIALFNVCQRTSCDRKFKCEGIHETYTPNSHTNDKISDEITQSNSPSKRTYCDERCSYERINKTSSRQDSPSTNDKLSNETTKSNSVCERTCCDLRYSYERVNQICTPISQSNESSQSTSNEKAPSNSQVDSTDETCSYERAHKISSKTNSQSTNELSQTTDGSKGASTNPEQIFTNSTQSDISVEDKCILNKNSTKINNHNIKDEENANNDTSEQSCNENRESSHERYPRGISHCETTRRTSDKTSDDKSRFKNYNNPRGSVEDIQKSPSKHTREPSSNERYTKETSRYESTGCLDTTRDKATELKNYNSRSADNDIQKIRSKHTKESTYDGTYAKESRSEKRIARKISRSETTKQSQNALSSKSLIRHSKGKTTSSGYSADTEMKTDNDSGTDRDIKKDTEQTINAESKTCIDRKVEKKSTKINSIVDKNSTNNDNGRVKGNKKDGQCDTSVKSVSEMDIENKKDTRFESKVKTDSKIDTKNRRDDGMLAKVKHDSKIDTDRKVDMDNEQNDSKANNKLENITDPNRKDKHNGDQRNELPNPEDGRDESYVNYCESRARNCESQSNYCKSRARNCESQSNYGERQVSNCERRPSHCESQSNFCDNKSNCGNCGQCPLRSCCNYRARYCHCCRACRPKYNSPMSSITQPSTDEFGVRDERTSYAVGEPRVKYETNDEYVERMYESSVGRCPYCCRPKCSFQNFGDDDRKWKESQKINNPDDEYKINDDRIPGPNEYYRTYDKNDERTFERSTGPYCPYCCRPKCPTSPPDYGDERKQYQISQRTNNPGETYKIDDNINTKTREPYRAYDETIDRTFERSTGPCCPYCCRPKCPTSPPDYGDERNQYQTSHRTNNPNATYGKSDEEYDKTCKTNDDPCFYYWRSQYSSSPQNTTDESSERPRKNINKTDDGKVVRTYESNEELWCYYWRPKYTSSPSRSSTDETREPVRKRFKSSQTIGNPDSAFRTNHENKDKTYKTDAGTCPYWERSKNICSPQTSTVESSTPERQMRRSSKTNNNTNAANRTSNKNDERTRDQPCPNCWRPKYTSSPQTTDQNSTTDNERKRKISQIIIKPDGNYKTKGNNDRYKRDDEQFDCRKPKNRGSPQNSIHFDEPERKRHKNSTTDNNHRTNDKKIYKSTNSTYKTTDKNVDGRYKADESCAYWWRPKYTSSPLSSTDDTEDYNRSDKKRQKTPGNFTARASENTTVRAGSIGAYNIKDEENKRMYRAIDNRPHKDATFTIKDDGVKKAYKTKNDQDSKTYKTIYDRPTFDATYTINDGRSKNPYKINEDPCKSKTRKVFEPYEKRDDKVNKTYNIYDGEPNRLNKINDNPYKIKKDEGLGPHTKHSEKVNNGNPYKTKKDTVFERNETCDDKINKRTHRESLSSIHDATFNVYGDGFDSGCHDCRPYESDKGRYRSYETRHNPCENTYGDRRNEEYYGRIDGKRNSRNGKYASSEDTGVTDERSETGYKNCAPVDEKYGFTDGTYRFTSGNKRNKYETNSSNERKYESKSRPDYGIDKPRSKGKYEDRHNITEDKSRPDYGINETASRKEKYRRAEDKYCGITDGKSTGKDATYCRYTDGNKGTKFETYSSCEDQYGSSKGKYSRYEEEKCGEPVRKSKTKDETCRPVDRSDRNIGSKYEIRRPCEEYTTDETYGTTESESKVSDVICTPYESERTRNEMCIQNDENYRQSYKIYGQNDKSYQCENWCQTKETYFDNSSSIGSLTKGTQTCHQETSTENLALFINGQPELYKENNKSVTNNTKPLTKSKEKRETSKTFIKSKEKHKTKIRESETTLSRKSKREQEPLKQTSKASQKTKPSKKEAETLAQSKDKRKTKSEGKSGSPKRKTSSRKQESLVSKHNTSRPKEETLLNRTKSLPKLEKTLTKSNPTLAKYKSTSPKRSKLPRKNERGSTFPVPSTHDGVGDKYEQYHHNAYLNYFVRLFRLERFEGKRASVVAKYAGKQWRQRMSEADKRPYYEMTKYAPVKRKKRK
ncbi:hypothetical protein M8J75_004529 [Diaphorina citri]|nr:hypothetical protein M8J75_004529 [Diaphorina citri]